MICISEQESSDLITPQLAFDAVRQAFVDAISGAVAFPAVIAHGSEPSNRMSIKSAAGPAIGGLKIGSYWPGNAALGLPRHNSTIILLDQSNGRVEAVIEAAKVNAWRTAAADAVAASVLARPDSRVLAIFGSGHQAEYECAALCALLPIEKVLVVARSSGKAIDLAGRLSARGIAASPGTARAACEAADIVVTATASREPLFEAEWVRPGTHVASMGSDAAGKQELPPALARRGRCFCDLPAQSVVMGEFQHVADDIASGAVALTPIGAVLDGRAAGRSARDEITIFDSSGIALQDLYVGRAILDKARASSPR